MKEIIQIEPSLGREEKKELLSVIDSGWFTEASKTKEFEDKFAKVVGCKYAIAVTSGTIALFIGLKAMGVSYGDQVIVPDLTFVASPNSVELTGGKSVLTDIESNSLNIDLKKLKEKINSKTKALMPVHFNGRSTNMLELSEFASKSDLLVIEDACHAIGSFYHKKHLGTFGEVGVFSFSTPKIITTGQGGMIVTNDKQIYDKCMSIKDFGRKAGIKKNMRKAFDHSTIGYNFKFTEFQAAIGLAQLRKLEQRIKNKKKMFKKYNELLSHIVDIEFIETNLNEVTPWMADILIKTKIQKDKLIKNLEKKKIQTRIFYPPIHRLLPYKESDTKYKTTSDISDRGIWLPSSVSITDDQIDLVCSEIIKYFKNKI